MRDISVRGVYRRYVVEPRIEFLGTTDPALVGDPKSFSVALDLMQSSTGSVRTRLEQLARKSVGPADWQQTTCDKYVGRLAYDQTWTHLDVSIKLAPDGNVDAATVLNCQDRWKAGIEDIWNNPAQSTGSPPAPWKCGRADEAPCRVSVKVEWVTSFQHHTVAVHLNSGGTNEGHWYTNDPGSTAAHEFGHMLGLPDEYPDAKCPSRSPTLTGTVMDNNSNFIPQRLVQFIADEIGSDLGY